MPTPDELKKFLEKHPGLQQQIEESIAENKGLRESQYNEYNNIPDEFLYAAYKENWDPYNLPENMAETAYREQQARKGEVARHTWGQFWENVVETGFKPAMEAVWGDVENRQPQYRSQTKYPIYNNPNIVGRHIGSGYWRNQITQMGTSVGMMAGLATDPVNIAFTVGSFFVPEAATPALAARIGNVLKKFNTAAKLGKVDKIAMSLAKFVMQGGPKKIAGARSGWMNARINQQFVQDDEYSRRIDMGYSPEEAANFAMKAGEKQFNLEKWADMLFGVVEFNILTRKLGNARKGLGAFVARDFRKAKSPLLRFGVDIGRSTVVESLQEVWEEMAAVYGGTAGEKDEIESFWKAFTTENGRDKMTADMDRYIDSAIGGAMGGALFGIVGKGVFGSAEAYRNSRSRKNLDSVEGRISNMIKNMRVRPSAMQVEIDKKIGQAAKKVDDAKSAFKELQEKGASRAKRKEALKKISDAEKELENLQIENSRLDMDTLLALKRSMMSLADADPENIANLNDNFNASMEAKINAISVIQEAMKTNPNILEDIKNVEELSDEQKNVARSIEVLKQYGILQNDNKTTNGLSLDEYKKQLIDFHEESINMDIDFVDGFNKYETQSMASRYMNLNARKRNIAKQIEKLSEKENKEIIDNVKAIISSESADDSDVKKALEFLINSGFINDYEKKEIGKIIDSKFADVIGLDEDVFGLISDITESDKEEDNEDAINEREERKKNSRVKLMKSKDKMLRKLVSSLVAKTEFVGKRKVRANESLQNLLSAASKAIHYNKVIEHLNKQSEAIDNILEDMQNERRQDYHYAKEAYYSCCVSVSESTSSIAGMLADVNDAILLCERKSLKNNEEIQVYKKELQKRYAYLLARLEEETENNESNGISQNVNVRTAINKEGVEKVRKTLRGIIRETICKNIIGTLKRETQQSESSIFDAINEYFSDFDIKSDIQTNSTEETTEETTEDNRVEKITDFFNQIKDGKTPSSNDTITPEVAKKINDAVEAVVEEKTEQIISDVHNATTLYSEQELQSAIEEIAEKNDVSPVDVMPVVTEIQTVFDGLKISGFKKDNPFYGKALSSMVNQVKLLGQPYETVIKPNINILHAIFKNSGFEDITIQDLQEALEKVFVPVEESNEEKIQTQENEGKLQGEEKKKVGTDYDVLQFTSIERDKNGNNVFVCRLKKKDSPVMDAKGFARLRSLSPSGQHRIYVKGFKGSFSANKKEFANYLKEIYGYTLEGRNLAKEKLFKTLGIDIDIALYDDEMLKTLWDFRSTVFACAIQPVYATNENGTDPVIVGFIPQADYYSEANCSLFRYENGQKVIGNESSREESIKELNFHTNTISNAQMSGDVEFSVGLRERRTSDINKGAFSKNVNANESSLKGGMNSDKEKGLINGIVYVSITDNSDSERTETQIPVHIKGMTFKDVNGEVRRFTNATLDKMNLREQNPEFFENFKNNLIDIILKYAANRLILDTRATTDQYYLWNACKRIVSKNRVVLRVDDEKEATENLFNYVDARIKSGVLFDLDAEIKSKTSGSSKKSRSAFFVANGSTIGNGFSIGVVGGHLQLSLSQSPKGQCQLSGDTVISINSLLEYVNMAFSEGGLAEKELISILDFRKNKTDENNSQFTKMIYRDYDCGNNLSQLVDDDFVPNKKDTQTVVEYINEKGETNINPVTLLDEDGDPLYDRFGNAEQTIYSGIIRTLKFKSNMRSVEPSNEIEDLEKGFAEAMNSLRSQSRIRSSKKLTSPNIIEGFSAAEQIEFCKSLFAYMLLSDKNFKQNLMDNKIRMDRCLKLAISLIKDNRKEVFKKTYDYYYRVRAVYDKLKGNKPTEANREYLKYYNFADAGNMKFKLNEIEEELIKAQKNIAFVDSLADEENLDKLFYLPKLSDQNVRVGMFTSYMANIFGVKLTLDDTTEIEQAFNALQNDSIEWFLKNDFEREAISDVSSYLKCVFSTVPSKKNKNGSSVVNMSLSSYEDIETVMALVGFALTQSQCNWNDFIRNLSNMADDKSYPYNDVCKEIRDILVSPDFPDQFKRETMSKLTKSFTNMLYVNQSQPDAFGKFRVTLNSVMGYKKKTNEMAKAKAFSDNAKYVKKKGEKIEYDQTTIEAYAKIAENIATAIANNKKREDSKKKEIDVIGIKKLISEMFGIEISTQTINSNQNEIQALLNQIADFAKKENQHSTVFSFCRKKLAKVVEKECYVNENTLDKTSFINGKTVMATYYRNLREKVFKDIENGKANLTYDNLSGLYKIEENGKEYWVNPQLGMVTEYPLETGLVSLSALSLESGQSERVTELSSGDQAALECIYNSEVFGDTTDEEIDLNVRRLTRNWTTKMRVREGYTLAYTVSDKQKLSWIKSQKIVIPMKEYVKQGKNYKNAGIDTEKLYRYVTAQILDGELLRIERELASDVVMPNKTGRHLILSIPELNLIEVNVNGHKQDLESLLRRCYTEGTEEVFKIIREDYDNIYVQARDIISHSIERSVANLICNEQAIEKIANGQRLLDSDGKLTISYIDMEESLWHKATVIEKKITSAGTIIQPVFVADDYEQGVLEKALPTRPQRNEYGNKVADGSIVDADLQCAYIAFDQVVNTYLTGVLMHNICYGPINNIAKTKGIDLLPNFDCSENSLYTDGKRNEENFNAKRDLLRSMCEATAVNNTKRMAGADGSGKMSDWEGIIHNDDPEWGGGKKHKNSIFKYIIVAETTKMAPTFKDILALHYPETKNDKEIETLIEEAKTNENKRKQLAKKYPKVAAFLNIDSTDGAEFVTAREAIDWLYGKGDLSESKYRKLLRAYDRLGGNLKKRDQKLIWDLMNEARMVMNPNKPMYYGTMILGKDGKPASDTNPAATMHTFYAKSAAIPLLPQYTANTPWENVRKVLEAMENENRMNCRLVFNSAIKVGNLEEGKTITLDKLINLGERMELGEKVSFDEVNTSSVYADRKFLMSQMETNSHREEIIDTNNLREKKVLNDIDEFLNNGQTKIVDSTQMEHIIDGVGINRIGGQIFKLPKRVCEQFGAKHDGKYYVSGKEFERIRREFTKRRIQEAYDDLVEELGSVSENDMSFENPAFVRNVARIIGNELLARGNDPNILNQLGFIEKYNPERNTYEFKIPLFLQAKSRNIQVLLMAIVRNRICKNKLPGNPLYTATSEQIKSKIISDKDDAFRKKGIIWLDKSVNGILGSQIDENGELKCADIAIPSQFLTRGKDGKMQHLDFYSTDDSGKLIYLVGENGQELYVDKDGEITTEHEGVYLNKEMIDDELIDRMMSLRIPVSGHMSGSAVRIVALLPDDMGDTIVVPSEHFMQLGEDLDIDKRFLYLKNYIIEKDGHVKVFTQEIMERMLDDFERRIDEDLANYVIKKRGGVEFETFADAIQYGMEYELNINLNKYSQGVYNRYRTKEVVLDAYRKKLEQKLRENENIDFYVSVFTCPDAVVQQKIQRVLNFDDLKATRDFVISSQDEKGTDFVSIFDNTYQSNMRIQNSSSLAGVGAMSLAVVQGAMLSKKNIYINGSFVMDGKKNTVYYGEGEFVDENLSALQNANVDNAKENVCGPINLNKETFPFYEMMAWLGFDKDSSGKFNLATLIASQPAIKKFVELKTAQKSNLKLRWYSNDDIIREVFKSVGMDTKRINDIMSGRDLDFVFKDGFFQSKVTSKEDPFGAEHFECTSSQLQDGISNVNPDSEVQMKAFMFFYNVLKRASGITKYTDLLNATSKGVGDSYFEVKRRIRLLNDMGEETIDGEGHGIHDLIGNFYELDDANEDCIIIPGCKWAIEPTTTEGIVLLNALKISEKLLSECFGYGKERISAIYTKIIDTMFESNIPLDKIESSEKQVVEGLKQYIYKMCGDREFMKYVFAELGEEVKGLWDKSFKEEEKRLLQPSYDEYRLDKNENFIQAMNEFLDESGGIKEIRLEKGKHVNLGYIVSFLKRSGLQSVAQNKFLSALEIGKNGIIIYKQRANTLTNSDVTNGFIEMYNNEEPITVNGHNVVANGEVLTWQDLAKDLASYAYLCDNENGIGNLREHIPAEYIEQTKTDAFLRYSYEHLERFVDVESFIDQFMSMNPEAMPQINANKKELQSGLKLYNSYADIEYPFDSSAINTIDTIVIKRPLSTEFVNAVGWKNNNNVVEFPKYIAVKSKKNTYIFKYSKETGNYHMLSKKSREYGSNNYDPSIATKGFENEVISNIGIIDDTDTEIKPTSDKTEIANQIRERFSPMNPAAPIINLVLEGMVANSGIHVVLHGREDGNSNVFFSGIDDNGHLHFELDFRHDITETQLAEEMMHLATLAEIVNEFDIEEKNGKKTYIPKKGKDNCFNTSFSIFNVFEKWWKENSIKFKRENKKLIDDTGYDVQINHTATDFAEFIAAGASMHPVFVKMMETFEKDVKMTGGNVIETIIDSIRRVFKKIIEKLFGNKPETVKSIIDDTIKAINIHFLNLDYVAMMFGNEDMKSLVDEKVYNLIETINNSIYEKNDALLQEASTVDSMMIPENNVRPEYRGKIVVTTYSQGKTTAANNENVIDIDYIWAEAFANYAYNSQLKNINNIIVADKWVEQRGGGMDDQFNKMQEYVTKRINELLDEGKTILANATILKPKYSEILSKNNMKDFSDRVAIIIAPKESTNDVLKRMEGKIQNSERRQQAFNEHLELMRKQFKKTKNVVLDKFVSDVIYDKEQDNSNAKNAFFVQIDEFGQREIVPIKVDNNENTISSEQQQKIESYPNLCK